MIKFGRITHVEDGHISRGQPRPYCKWIVPIFRVPFYLCLHPLMQNYQTDVVIPMGGGLFLCGKQRPHPKGWGPVLSNFGGFPSIYEYTLCCRTIKCDTVTRGGSACTLGSDTPFIPREEFQRSPILGVLPHLCPHPLMQIDQIWHGNTHRKGRAFRSTTPLHLQNLDQLTHLYMYTLICTHDCIHHLFLHTLFPHNPPSNLTTYSTASLPDSHISPALAQQLQLITTMYQNM